MGADGCSIAQGRVREAHAVIKASSVMIGTDQRKMNVLMNGCMKGHVKPPVAQLGPNASLHCELTLEM